MAGREGIIVRALGDGQQFVVQLTQGRVSRSMAILLLTMSSGKELRGYMQVTGAWHGPGTLLGLLRKSCLKAFHVLQILVRCSQCLSQRRCALSTSGFPSPASATALGARVLPSWTLHAWSGCPSGVQLCVTLGVPIRLHALLDMHL